MYYDWQVYLHMEHSVLLFWLVSEIQCVCFNIPNVNLLFSRKETNRATCFAALQDLLWSKYKNKTKMLELCFATPSLCTVYWWYDGSSMAGFITNNKLIQIIVANKLIPQIIPILHFD